MSTVSVIVPTFNRAEWIGRTLRSVLAQTMPVHEIIVVDDGSTDDTERVVAGLGGGIRYVRQANAGVAAARNHGAELATGEWLAFLDSDDLWFPRKNELQVCTLAQCTTAGWSLTSCNVVDLEDREIAGREGFEASFPVFRQEGVSARDFFARYLTARTVAVSGMSIEVFEGDLYDALFLGNVGLPSSTMIRRDLFRDAGGFNSDFRVAEETEFYHRISVHAPVAILMTPLVGYRIGRDGTLTSPANSERLILNALRSVEQAAALRLWRTAQGTQHYHEGRRRLLKRLAYTRLSNLDGRGARDALARAWDSGAPRDARSLALYAAACLPSPALRGLHRLKRALA